MKNIITLFLISFFGNILFGQSEQSSEMPQEKNWHHQIGFNAGLLLDRFVKNQDDTLLKNNSYYLRHKFIANRWAWRTAFGILYKVNDRKIDGFNDVSSTKLLMWNTEFGLERQINLSHKWLINLGANGIYYYGANQKILDSGFDRVVDTYRSDEYGVGLIFGTEYKILKQLSLSIESNLQYTVYVNTQKSAFYVFTSFNSPVTKNTGTNIKFYGPISLFINYSF